MRTISKGWRTSPKTSYKLPVNWATSALCDRHTFGRQRSNPSHSNSRCHAMAKKGTTLGVAFFIFKKRIFHSRWEELPSIRGMIIWIETRGGSCVPVMNTKSNSPDYIHRRWSTSHLNTGKTLSFSISFLARWSSTFGAPGFVFRQWIWLHTLVKLKLSPLERWIRLFLGQTDVSFTKEKDLFFAFLPNQKPKDPITFWSKWVERSRSGRQKETPSKWRGFLHVRIVEIFGRRRGWTLKNILLVGLLPVATLHLWLTRSSGDPYLGRNHLPYCF